MHGSPRWGRAELVRRVVLEQEPVTVVAATLVISRQTAYKWLNLHLTRRGRHAGFLEADRRGDPDRYWAENRVIDFLNLAAGSRLRRS